MAPKHGEILLIIGSKPIDIFVFDLAHQLSSNYDIAHVRFRGPRGLEASPSGIILVQPSGDQYPREELKSVAHIAAALLRFCDNPYALEWFIINYEERRYREAKQLAQALARERICVTLPSS